MTTRTRSRGALVPPSGGVTDASLTVTEAVFDRYTDHLYKLPVGVYSGVAFTHGYSNTLETMTDEVGSGPFINNVTHQRETVDAVDVGEHAYHLLLANPDSSARAELRIGGDLCDSMLHDYRDLSATISSNGAALALSRVPSWEPEVARLFVSLFELKDLLGEGYVGSFIRGFHPSQILDKNGKKVSHLWRHLPKETKQTINSWGKGDLDPVRILRSLISADLELKFNILPLVGEIQKVRSTLGRVIARLDDLAHKPVTFKGMHSETARLTHQPYVYGWDIGSTVSLPSCVKCYDDLAITTTRTWVYGIVKKLRLEKLQAEHHIAAQSIAAERLGLNARVSDAWQVVPLSFVLDWFLPIRNFLDQFNVPSSNVTEWFDTLGAWSSTKTVTTRVAKSEFRYEPVANAPHYALQESGRAREVTSTSVDYQRVALSALPEMAEMPIYWPSWHLPGQPGKYVTALELIVSGLIGGPTVGRPVGSR